MARDGSGVYSLPSGSIATTGQTILAATHNTPIQDIAADLNIARPVVAGGTGATTASGARTNLGLGSLATQNTGSAVVTVLDVDSSDQEADPSFKVRRSTDDGQYIGFAADATANWIIAESAANSGKQLVIDNRTGGVNRHINIQQDGTTFARIDDPSYVGVTSGATTLLKRSQADGRYAQLAAANTFQETITINDNTPYVQWYESDQSSGSRGGSIGMSGGDIVIHARTDALAVDTNLAFFRRNGNVEFPNGSLDVGGNITASGDFGVSGYMRSTGYVYAHASNTGNGIQIGHGGTNALINNRDGGDLLIQFNGTSEFTFQSNGGVAGGSNDVVNRGAGDARYAQLGASNTFTGGALKLDSNDGGASVGAFRVSNAGYWQGFRNTATGSDGILDLYSDYTTSENNVFRVRADGSILSDTPTISSFSDERLKENMEPIGRQLEDVMKIEIINFNRKGAPRKQLGVSAQALQKIKPELVHTDEKSGYLYVDYTPLDRITMRALQDHVGDTHAELAALKARLEALEAT